MKPLSPGALEPDRGAGLIGRERELAELQAAASGALGGRSGFFLISGEAGIGKTSLADCVAQSCSDDFAVGWGRCWEGGGAPALWPWIELLGELVRSFEESERRHILSGVAADAAPLVPSAGVSGLGLAEGPPLDPVGRRFRLYQAVGALLENAARVHPILLILDDLHDADPDSLRMLTFVARTCRSGRLLLVATSREAEVVQKEDLVEPFAALSREMVTLPLGGLSEGDIERIVVQRLGRDIGTEVVASLRDASGGNPYYLDEALRVLAARPTHEGSKPLPAELLSGGVRAAVQRRLGDFSDLAVQVLRRAALIGREFSLSLLESICSEYAEEVVTAIDGGVRVGVLGRGERPASYRFVHDLTREALLSTMELAERARGHLEIARALERSGTADSINAAEVAHHYLSAGAAGDPERAVHYARLAGNQARQATAADQAVHWYRRALEAVDQLGDGADRDDLMLELGDALSWSGDTERGRDILVKLAEQAEQRGDDERFAQITIRIGAHQPESGTPDERRIRLLDQARARLEGSGSALEARVKASLVSALYFSEGRERVGQLSIEAVETARASGNKVALAYALQARLLAMWGPDGDRESWNIATEGLALIEGEGELHHLVFVFYTRRLIHVLEHGDALAADSEIEAIERATARIRDPRANGYLILFRAMRQLMRGELGDAEMSVLTCMGLAERFPGEQNLFQFAGIQLFVIRREQGRLAELEPIVRGLVSQYPRVPTWRAVLALSLAETDQEEAARRELGVLSVDNFRAIPRDGNWMVTVAVLAEVCEILGDAARAKQLYELLAPVEGRHVVIALGAAYYGSVPRYLGILAATMGETELARRHFETAEEREGSAGANAILADTRLHLAEILRALAGARALHQSEVLAGQVESAVADFTLPRLGERYQRLPKARERPVQPEVSPAGDAYVFLRSGDVWLIGTEEDPFRLENSRGLEQLHRLLCQPGESFLALDLLSDNTPEGGSSSAEPSLSVRRSDSEDLVIDGQARASYKRHLRSLRELIAEAEANNDSARVSHLREEFEQVTEFLAAATGVGGRGRRQSGPAERARVNVKRTIQRALGRIREHDGSLADLLDRAIRTGRFCSYEPDPSHPIEWILLDEKRS